MKGFWKLVGQSAAALLVANALLLNGGAALAIVSSPPLRYDEFNTIIVGFLISLGVGTAAVLANADDAERSEFF